jgi:sRNA-binding protein
MRKLIVNVGGTIPWSKVLHYRKKNNNKEKRREKKRKEKRREEKRREEKRREEKRRERKRATQVQEPMAPCFFNVDVI